MQQSIINIRVILRLRLFQQAYRQTDIQIYFFSFTLIIDRNSSFSLEKRANIDTEYLQAYVDIMKIENQPFLLQINAYFQENLQKFDNSSTSTTIKNGNLELIKK